MIAVFIVAVGALIVLDRCAAAHDAYWKDRR